MAEALEQSRHTAAELDQQNSLLLQQLLDAQSTAHERLRLQHEELSLGASQLGQAYEARLSEQRDASADLVRQKDDEIRCVRQRTVAFRCQRPEPQISDAASSRAAQHGARPSWSTRRGGARQSWSAWLGSSRRSLRSQHST